jgi:hypothetical protein
MVILRVPGLVARKCSGPPTTVGDELGGNCIIFQKVDFGSQIIEKDAIHRYGVEKSGVGRK